MLPCVSILISYSFYLALVFINDIIFWSALSYYDVVIENLVGLVLCIMFMLYQLYYRYKCWSQLRRYQDLAPPQRETLYKRISASVYGIVVQPMLILLLLGIANNEGRKRLIGSIPYWTLLGVAWVSMILTVILFRNRMRFINYWLQSQLYHNLLEVPEEANCSICLDNEKTKPWIQTNCNHIFHQDCIDPWLMQSPTNPTCPNCRGLLLDANMLV